jgi:hypothetical protein
MTLTILHEDGEATVGSAAIPATELAAATGWQLKSEGLCRGEICIPVRDQARLVVDGHVAIGALGAALHRPVVVDEDAGIAALGADPIAVSDELHSRHAANFTLPALDGAPFEFHSIGRKKKLIIAWASW